MAIVLVGTIALGSKAAGKEDLAERHYKSTQILEELRKNIAASSRQEVKLADEISALNSDRAALNERLIGAASKSRQLEQKIERASTRVLEMEESHQELRQSLAGRRALLSEVLGALQRMGINPPPALLITPKDALTSVRSAILLGSVIPEIRSETQILANELSQLQQLSEAILIERLQLTNDLEIEAEEEIRLASLIKEKKSRSRLAREKLATQGVEAAKLAARATNLTNLIDKLGSEIEAVREAANAAIKADADREKRQLERIASARKEVERPNFSDSSRISPAVEFTRAKGHLIKPVSGVEIRKFGDLDELGERSPGIEIATRINARVISPADGWVVYSGPFRSYGQLLILKVGTNHHIVMSGMEKLDVELGQFVLVGEPVGIMGSRRIASAGTIELGLSRPVLSIEFRNNGKSINPASWWQVNANKRASNDS